MLRFIKKLLPPHPSRPFATLVVRKYAQAPPGGHPGSLTYTRRAPQRIVTQGRNLARADPATGPRSRRRLPSSLPRRAPGRDPAAGPALLPLLLAGWAAGGPAEAAGAGALAAARRAAAPRPTPSGARKRIDY